MVFSCFTANLGRRFAQILRGFAQVFRDFARIFNKSKHFGVRLHPLHLRLLNHCCVNMRLDNHQQAHSISQVALKTFCQDQSFTTSSVHSNFREVVNLLSICRDFLYVSAIPLRRVPQASRMSSSIRTHIQA